MNAIAVLGVPELVARFARDAEVGIAAAGAAAFATAEEVAAIAQSIVPVDTGNLRDSIHAVKEGDMKAAVVTEVEYAPYVEFGTSVQTPQPYMRPAADIVGAEVGLRAGAIVLQGI